MPRGTFKHEDAQQGGFGIQEGNVLVVKSVIGIHQFPPSSKTGEQSDPFTALIWTVQKLDQDWNAQGDGETENIYNRLGAPDQIRPGKLDPKDFDNMDAEPEDLGAEVGTEGNAIYLEAGAKINRGWAIMEESLRKAGFKPEISGRGIASDFDGMKLHVKTVEGQKYIATKGKNKGQEVTPTNLVCDRVHTFPYDKKKAGTGTPAKPSTAASKANGSANGAASDDPIVEAVNVVKALSPEFLKDVPAGKEVKIDVFYKAMTKELFRKKVNAKMQKAIMDALKDGEKLIEIASESGVFTTDGSSVELSA